MYTYKEFEMTYFNKRTKYDQRGLAVLQIGEEMSWNVFSGALTDGRLALTVKILQFSDKSLVVSEVFLLHSALIVEMIRTVSETVSYQQASFWLSLRIA